MLFLEKHIKAGATVEPSDEVVEDKGVRVLMNLSKLFRSQCGGFGPKR